MSDPGQPSTPPDRHLMTPAVFLALARGGGGPAAVRLLLAGQHSRNLLTLREVVERCADLDHPHTDAVRRAWLLLAALRRVDAGAVGRVLTYPSVSAWAAQTLRQLLSPEASGTPTTDGQPVWPGMLGAVATAAAWHVGMPATVRFPTPPGSAFRLPMAGHVRVDRTDRRDAAAPTVAVTVTGHGLAVDGVPLRPGVTWWPVPRLRAGRLDLRLDDVWSLARPSAPPSGAQAAHWRSTLAPGWRLLATRHRAYAAELAVTIRMIMPLHRQAPELTAEGTPEETAATLISGTFPTGVGCVAISGGGDPATTAAALVHELAHNKLAALESLFPLLEPGDDVRWPAPWRIGPRPLPALLQGLYAHVCVARFWQHQQHHESRPAGRSRARWQASRTWADCRDVAEQLLAGDRLTRHGRLLVEQLHRTSAARRR